MYVGPGSPGSEFGAGQGVKAVADQRALTRIQATTPHAYVPFGQRVVASGVLEGWTGAGWQPLAGRAVTVSGGPDDPAARHVVTNQAGAYETNVRAMFSFEAGQAYFAGDDCWLAAYSHPSVQVHARLTCAPSEGIVALGREVRVSGKVVPGAMPVWLEQFDGSEWTRVTEPVRADSEGRYGVTFRPTTSGLLRMRVWTDGTEAGVLPYSREFTLSVGSDS